MGVQQPLSNLQVGLASVTNFPPTRKLVAAGAFGRFITVSQQKDLEEASCLLGVFRVGDDAQTKVDAESSGEARSQEQTWLSVGKRCTTPSIFCLSSPSHPPSCERNR